MSADLVINAAAAGAAVGRDAIAMLIDRAQVANSSDSLVSFTQAARVEPLVLVDTDALFIEELHDVLQSLNSIFSGYYLQAIQLDSAIGNVKVMETLNKFNPNGMPMNEAIGRFKKDLTGTVLGALDKHDQRAHFATESYADALPDFSMLDDDISLEARGGARTPKPRKVDSPFDTDVSYKNWKQQREIERDKQQSRQDAERKNDRRQKLRDDAQRRQDDAQRRQEHREDRDHLLGQRQDQANRQAKQDRRDLENELDRAADRDHQLHERAYQQQERERQAAERDAAARKAEEEAQRVTTSFGGDALKDVKEASNLSVGKLLDVEIKHNGQTFQVPVAIRLVVNTIPSAQLVHILSLTQQHLTSAKERFHAWKAGRLSFVKDLIFCRDLIDEHRRSLMRSSDSVYHNVIKKEQKSLAAAFLGGVPSVAAASNMVVTTTNTIEEVELSMPGKFSDFKARQKIFEDTSLMIVAVIDKEWNRVTFYHRGLPEATEVSFRDIKASNKGSGPDVSDILKAYTLGQAPRL
jgi:hypothetical protein